MFNFKKSIMKTIQKIGAVIGAIVLCFFLLILISVSSLLFYLSYLVTSEESVLFGIVSFTLSIIMFFIVLGTVFMSINYFKKQFKRCENCGNKIHQNTSLGGTTYVRFTCIDCRESKWSDEIEF